MIRKGIRVIGLTGGIASGKSTVAGYMAEEGVPVIDADQLARDAVLPGSQALERIVAVFGTEILTADGVLDRKRLGAIIFASEDKRHQLEGILHPEIRRLGEERISQASADGYGMVVYMAPVLIEAGAAGHVDEIWVVTVRPEIQLERLMQRDGIGRDDAVKIISAQMPLSEKERYGKVVIDNSGTPDQTRRLFKETWIREMERMRG